MSQEALTKQICTQLATKVTNNQLIEWLETTVSEEDRKHSKFMRALVTAVFKNALFYSGMNMAHVRFGLILSFLLWLD